MFATPQGDDSVKAEGKLTFIDNNVDMTTGTIKLKGTFNNHDRKLWPGEFVRVADRCVSPRKPTRWSFPNQAVQTGQNGQFVYVVKADQTVEPRALVITGARVDQDLVVNKGLSVGRDDRDRGPACGSLRALKVRWDGFSRNGRHSSPGLLGQAKAHKRGPA